MRRKLDIANKHTPLYLLWKRVQRVMSTAAADVAKPSGLRLASQYKAAERRALVRDQYPVTLPTTSTFDFAYCQALLSNASNFAEQTICDIFDLSPDGKGDVRIVLGDKEFQEYITISKSSGATHATRIIFLTSQRFNGTTFASQVSLSQVMAQKLLQKFEITPNFVPSLLSEPDYAAPGTFSSYDSAGQLCKQEFICQHPRWDIHVKLQPCSVYMSFQKETSNTLYIVVSGETDSCVKTAKERLQDTLIQSRLFGGDILTAPDPFYLHNIIAQESFLQSKPVITKLRFRLYDQLDKVDGYGNGTLALDRAALKALTNDLHGVSQDADGLISSAEMGTMIAEGMHKAHHTLEMMSDVRLQKGFHPIGESLDNLVESLHARRRWILS